MNFDKILEKDILPDAVLRYGIRRLLKNRLRHEHVGDSKKLNRHKANLIEELKKSPIALNTSEANQQHY